ncbi:glycosyltransferase family 2 protein [Ornithobacterium rhinotracheale]
MNDIILDILITTYNLQDYIEKTLQSVLTQKTEYKYRILIYDDCSTDNTIEIIKKIKNSHPKGDCIELHVQSKNKGVKENTYDLFKLATAKYISFLDGDDWWIDEQKIQKQVSFLENNPDFNLCTGRHKKYFQKTGKMVLGKELVNTKKVLTLKDYLAFNFSQTSAHCYRNNFEVPEFFAKTIANDQLQVILSTQDGKIKYFDDFFAAYRIHYNSNSHNQKKKTAFEDTKYFLEQLDEYTNYKYSKILNNRKKINKLYFKWTSSSNKFKRLYYRILMLGYRLYAYKFLTK